jgi:hypothetical protein
MPRRNDIQKILVIGRQWGVLKGFDFIHAAESSFVFEGARLQPCRKHAKKTRL